LALLLISLAISTPSFLLNEAQLVGMPIAKTALTSGIQFKVF